MTTAEITRVVEEIERRWRSRTPATRVDEVNASYRVSRGEIRLWCHQNEIDLDEFNEQFQVESLRMFIRLRREFPDERWDHDYAATKELAKRHGLKLPRRTQGAKR